MMKNRALIFLSTAFFLVSMVCYASAPSFQIYINGILFNGKFFVENHSVYVESQGFAEALDLPDSTSFPIETERTYLGSKFVSLSAYARITHAAYSINQETGIVDFYQTSPAFSHVSQLEPTAYTASFGNPIVAVPSTNDPRLSALPPAVNAPYGPDADGDYGYTFRPCSDCYTVAVIIGNIHNPYRCQSFEKIPTSW